ncbi:MAG: triose-phosphate isomerase [Candidatus Cloacimonadaceae bacterium]
MRNLMIAGNWKMNKDLFETLAFTQGLKAYAEKHTEAKVEIVIAPAYPFLMVASDLLKGTVVKLSAQDVSLNEDGAFTGEVSATMLASLHLPFCIIGHSERRQYHQETDESVNSRLKQLLKNGITPIFCIGEKLQEREAEQTNAVLERQLKDGLADINLYTGKEIVIAYEPVWAIGTGKVATPQQAQDAHGFIRSWLKAKFGDKVSQALQILYGGSVKPDNINELMLQQDIDGALIGGASLKLEQFIAMLDSATEVVKKK